MAIENKKLSAMLSDIKGSDYKIAKKSFDKFRKDGESQSLLAFIKAFTSSKSGMVYDEGKKVLFDIKDENAVDVIFQALVDPELTKDTNMLCSVLWEAGMDCKDKLNELIDIAMQGDSTTVLEVLTVIENMDTLFPVDEIANCKFNIIEATEESTDEIKNQLTQGLIEVLDQMVE